MIFDERYNTANMDARTRRENSIYACKVLSKSEQGKVTLDSGISGITPFVVPLPFGADEIHEGDFLDVQLHIMVYDNGRGKVIKNVNKMSLVGVTPKEFIPNKA